MDLTKAWKERERGYEIVAEMRKEKLRTLSHERWLHGLRVVWSIREPHQGYFRLALGIQRELGRAGLKFCFIGGLALQRWGEVRYTEDIDLTVLCPLGSEESTVETLTDILGTRSDEPLRLATIARMFVGTTPDGTEVDVSLGFMPYEQRMIERAVDVDFGIEESLRCCSPEDLVITKTVAGRGQDWVDLARIAQRSGRDMNWDLVFEELGTLLEWAEQPEHADRLRDILSEEGLLPR